ncbi:MAG: hypothetical protein Q9204_004942 [Flavoplaca sp. TL-2023a]
MTSAFTEEDIYETSDTAAKDDKLVPAVGPQRIDEAVSGATVARIDVFAEKREHEPYKTRKSQPVSDTPGEQDQGLRQPYPPCGFIVRPQTRGEIDWKQ